MIFIFFDQDARGKIWMCDIDGLLTTTRTTGNLEGHKQYYAKNHKPIKDLAQIVKEIKPTVYKYFVLINLTRFFFIILLTICFFY